MKTETVNTIVPGIYRHFKGNLYFVLGLAWSRDDWANPEKAEVIYHPLYPVENLGWRRDITLEKFFGPAGAPEPSSSTPRFLKVIDWELPNILPGKTFVEKGRSDLGVFTIKQVIQVSTREVLVEATGVNVGPVKIGVEAFRASKYQIIN
ncbi:MAG: hypothetical protein UT65_C0014G0010 [Parcubacteria group bacterium GW2011_GWF2_39_8b]|uniref:DUF1653 domain-containing protein n=2 Tax=Candidatus Zambryskiibacteriota TaxID=1817925 RepID=A0A1G2T6E7_9BACT|nr:MAG: hypothetical protein UT65_C0014G0010 [Parcubacteria group bacterium GW2011_GWF2_39_8b]KKR45914.1 MAG: hypothetical protein UT81_C0004G0012 [Parcubacteria group bacterium GW2011_GWA2_40_14]OHA92742.1 MAG: hypothetical protein A2W58_03130 [Candidatus Zambryskibacteria bacterium RIFCSPHIGHO2_02_38_10.5]OHA97089.1 MAG: hypothetical protein A3C63_00740 [Candidatus Zambryskibacteria bacterium RIFCSPHIGHO2_02_FULL_39_82]OHA99740.1 MAG: hypothetical protein A3E32_00705 [Candidatus Zambryskibact